MKIREKLERYGIEYLTDEELLTMLNLTGDSSSLATLLKCESIKEVSYKLQVTDRAAEKLFAVLEIARRLTTMKAIESPHLGSPQECADFLAPLMTNRNTEEFMALLVNSKNKLIKAVTVSTGSLNASVVHPREVFKQACIYNAGGVIVAHNHPSGDPTPSMEDRTVTAQLVASGKDLGIPLLDHLVIGKNGTYYSFQENSDL